jgi:hypothetical protein
VLNALIGEEILSVAVEPTTAVPTRVRYGREFNIFVERSGGDGPALFEDDPPFWTRFVGRRDTLSTLEKQQGTIRDFLRTWTKEGERAGEVERVVIELPLDWLKGGLELIDTPGVNNEFARHQGFTEQEAGAADIAVLLMDARQGGGKRTEFEFMNEVQAQVERCVVAPNKLDLVPEGEREEFLGYIRETALPKHWDGAVTPPVIGISALAALRPDEHDEPDLVDAFEGLRDRLERVAEEERGSLLLSRKGNPEKRLFARAKELEGEKHYGRAHRLYFDLLDVLEAAGLDPTPAKEGVARCEEHLSTQVDTLDALNERYNEAMALAEEDPDAALEELTAIRDEKEDLRLKDGDLHASIERLERRIEERDAARREIREIWAQVEQHRHNENWIEAAEAAQKIPSLIETAELSAEQTDTLRQFVATQMQDRDEWAENRWMAIKDEADACVEDQRFLDAKDHLDELEAVAPYTPFGEETADFLEDVEEKADLEGHYRRVVQSAVEEAEVLRRDRVDLEKGRAVESAIETAEETHQALYGTPDLPTRPPLEDDALPLTIYQKLGLARQLRTVAERAPTRDEAAALVAALENREVEIEALPVENRDGLDLVEAYPDHPEAEAALDELLNKRLSLWAFPSRIWRMQSAIEKYQDYLPEEVVKNRIEELDKRAGFFEWHYEDSLGAAWFTLIGFVIFTFGIYQGGIAFLSILVAAFFIVAGFAIQYYKPSRNKEDQKNNISSDELKSSSQPSESHVDTCNQSRQSGQKNGGGSDYQEYVSHSSKGRPAGTWKCPNCGNSKHKEEGFKKVPCQSCGTEMRFVRDKMEAEEDEIARFKDEQEESKSCDHNFETNRIGETICQKCGQTKSFLELKKVKVYLVVPVLVQAVWQVSHFSSSQVFSFGQCMLSV